MRIRWYGQSAFLLEGEKRVLIDPFGALGETAASRGIVFAYLPIAPVEVDLLLGDPSKPGPYIRLVKWLPGNMSRPHYHSTTRHFYIASGTWWVGSSNTYDPAKTYPMRAGTFVTHYAGKAHFDGAKDEEVVVQLIGVGPSGTSFIHPELGTVGKSR